MNDVEFLVYRILHIVFGSFWVGSALFLTIILEPRLRAMGPNFHGPVMGAVTKVAGPTLLGSGAITVVVGIIMVYRMRSGTFDHFFDTGWGWAITIGFVTAVAALIIGSVVARTSNHLRSMAGAIQVAGRPMTPGEEAQMGTLSTRLVMLARIAAALVLIALGAMASVRVVGY